MKFRIVQRDSKERDSNVVSGMIQPGEESPNHEKENRGGSVELHVENTAEKITCENMIVLPQEELDRVDVNGIDSGTAGGLLMVMVFVDVAVNGLDVKSPVKDGVKEVVNDEDYWDG